MSTLLERFHRRALSGLDDAIKKTASAPPVAAALQEQRDSVAADIAAILTAEVEALAAALEPDEKVRDSMLDRDLVVDGWPWPWAPQRTRRAVLAALRQELGGDTDEATAFTKLAEQTREMQAGRLKEGEDNLFKATFKAIGGMEAPSSWVGLAGLALLFKTPSPPKWPPHAAPADVAAWLRQAKNPTADEVASYLERGELWGPTKENEELPVTPKLPVGWLYLGDKPRNAMAVCAPDGLRWPFAGCALLYLARQDVERGRHRALVAIDAGQVHHGLVSGWRDLPKHRGAEVHGAATIKVKEGFRLELWAPDRRPVQLLLPIEDPTGGIHDAVVRQLRDIANWEGLRNWAAWLRLLSVEGGRQGWVRWTVDAHLAALNTRKCTPEAKERVARIVELFTKLELAVIGPDGRTRERRPLVLVGQRREVKVNSQWRLDGMELQMNPLLYSGVRNQETKRLGCNWWPASPELPQIDHIRHPYACALGLLLPIRFRWDYGDGRDHTTLKGRNLLETAGIAFDKNTPDRAWKVLARDLDELKRIGELRRWEWDTGAPGLDAMCNIYPPPRALDIIKRGLLPERTAPTPSILTGGELREWRQRHGWTQGQTARELGVHPRTIMRAELNPDRRLGPALRAAVRRTLPPGER